MVSRVERVAARAKEVTLEERLLSETLDPEGAVQLRGPDLIYSFRRFATPHRRGERVS